MKLIKTDRDVVNIARQIDTHLQIVRSLIDDIEQSEHPNKDEIVYALNDNSIWVCAWATHVISHGLEHPEKWETGDFGIRYKPNVEGHKSRKRIKELFG